MDFLDKMILDNTMRSYIFVFLIIAVVILFKRILSHYIASLLYRVIHRNRKLIEKQDFISLIIKPLGSFLVILVSVFAIDKLIFPAAWKFAVNGMPFNDILEKTGTALIIISFFYFLISFINFIALLMEQNPRAAQDKNHSQVILFFRDLLKVFAVIIGVLFILKTAFNKDIGNLLTGLSIVGAALALAAKESIENLIASFVIFFDKPFFTGDIVKVNTITGTVEHIGLRSTRIRTPEKTLVTVPNKKMVDSIVDNLSMRTQRRGEIKLVLSQKNKPENIKQLIESLKILFSEMPDEISDHSVSLTDYNREGATVTVEFFTPAFSMAEFDSVKQNVNFNIMGLIADRQIEMSSAASSINIFNTDGEGGSPKQEPLL